MDYQSDHSVFEVMNKWRKLAYPDNGLVHDNPMEILRFKEWKEKYSADKISVDGPNGFTIELPKGMPETWLTNIKSKIK